LNAKGGTAPPTLTPELPDMVTPRRIIAQLALGERRGAVHQFLLVFRPGKIHETSVSSPRQLCAGIAPGLFQLVGHNGNYAVKGVELIHRDL